MTPSVCPQCDLPAEARCRCQLADARCENGHHWHTCPKCGVVTVGEGNHKVSTTDPANWCGACRTADDATVLA